MTKEDLISLFCEIMKYERALTLVDRLLEAFGSPERIVQATPDTLMRVKGMDEGALSLLCVTVSLAARRRMETFRVGEKHSEREIARYLSGLFLGMSAESIVLLSLDKNKALLGVDSLGSGTVNASSFNIRHALEIALRRGASYVILAHNHPCGTTEPSLTDLETTVTLRNAFRTVDVPLLAHMILAGGSYDFVGDSSGLLT